MQTCRAEGQGAEEIHAEQQIEANQKVKSHSWWFLRRSLNQRQHINDGIGACRIVWCGLLELVECPEGLAVS